MKKALLFVLALAVIPVGVDAQGTPPDSCSDINPASPLEDVRSCAEQGDAVAQFGLGFVYAEGRGVPEDDVEALRWWRLAADQGDARAQFNLGLRYDNGEGVPEDDAEAVRWYRLAAEQGLASAQKNIGDLYANGEGVPEDHVLAYMWWNLAAAQGNEGAQELKDIIEQQMTLEQIANPNDCPASGLRRIPPTGTSS